MKNKIAKIAYSKGNVKWSYKYALCWFCIVLMMGNMKWGFPASWDVSFVIVIM
jgi:hypothetical protein